VDGFDEAFVGEFLDGVSDGTDELLKIAESLAMATASPSPSPSSGS
jgi:hypothetical protein